MSRSTLQSSRWRRLAVGLSMVALPFTLASCAEDEPVDEPGIVEEEPLEGEEEPLEEE